MIYRTMQDLPAPTGSLPVKAVRRNFNSKNMYPIYLRAKKHILGKNRSRLVYGKEVLSYEKYRKLMGIINNSMAEIVASGNAVKFCKHYFVYARLKKVKSGNPALIDWRRTKEEGKIVYYKSALKDGVVHVRLAYDGVWFKPYKFRSYAATKKNMMSVIRSGMASKTYTTKRI